MRMKNKSKKDALISKLWYENYMKNLGKDTKVNNKNFRKKSLKPLNYNYYNPLNTMQNYD